MLFRSVHKRDLHQIHHLAWKRGVKSLYYCRSLSIQRADTVSDMLAKPTSVMEAPAPAKPANYEECLACQ